MYLKFFDSACEALRRWAELGHHFEPTDWECDACIKAEADAWAAQAEAYLDQEWEHAAMLWFAAGSSSLQ